MTLVDRAHYLRMIEGLLICLTDAQRARFHATLPYPDLANCPTEYLPFLVSQLQRSLPYDL